MENLSPFAEYGLLGILLGLFLLASWKIGNKMINYFLKEKAKQHEEELKLRDENFKLIVKDNQDGFGKIDNTLKINAAAEQKRELDKEQKRIEFTDRIFSQFKTFTASMEQRYNDLHAIAIGHEADIARAKEDHKDLKEEVRRNRNEIDGLKKG